MIIWARTTGPEPGTFGVVDGQEIARFAAAKGDALILVSASVPLYVPEGTRFRRSALGEKTAPAEDVLKKLYLGMPREEVEAVLGRRDGEGSGLDFWLYINLGSVYFIDGLATRFSFGDRIWDVDELTSAALLAQNSTLPGADGYLAESHVRLAITADKDSLTVYGLSLCRSYNLAGDYDIRATGEKNTPYILTFTRDSRGHYQLAQYWVPGETGNQAALRARFPESTWEELSSGGYREFLSDKCASDAWFHFYGVAPHTVPFGVEMGVVQVTNVAIDEVVTANDLSVQDYAYFLVQYFPGARVRIEEVETEKIGFGWVLQYDDTSKDREIRGPGADVEITPDLVGLYQPATCRYAMIFKKYVYP